MNSDCSLAMNAVKIWVNQQLKTNKNNYTTNLEFKNKAKDLLSKAILKKYNFVLLILQFKYFLNINHNTKLNSLFMMSCQTFRMT